LKLRDDAVAMLGRIDLMGGHSVINALLILRPPQPAIGRQCQQYQRMAVFISIISARACSVLLPGVCRGATIVICSTLIFG
jgi:hypothetical protein